MYARSCKHCRGGWLHTPRSLFKDERDTSVCSKKRDRMEEMGTGMPIDAGRTADLSAARLEQMARVLGYSPEQGNQDTANGDAREAGDGRDWPATDLAGQHHHSRSSSRETPLLVPKFQLPPLHPSLVPRERRLSLLDRALEHRLTLASAPAGYGKTTLLRQWVAERGAKPR